MTTTTLGQWEKGDVIGRWILEGSPNERGVLAEREARPHGAVPRLGRLAGTRVLLATKDR